MFTHENKYYKLQYKFILKYVNQEIVKKFEENKIHDFYTYLSINNKYYILRTKIDNNCHETYRLLNIIKAFEKVLDISLLKPVDEWDNEEINTKKKYYEKEYKDKTENNPKEDNIEK